MINADYESPSVEFLSDMDMAGVNAGAAFIPIAVVAAVVWNVAVVWNWGIAVAAGFAIAAAAVVV